MITIGIFALEHLSDDSGIKYAMRPFEIFVTVANAVALCALFMPRSYRNGQVSRYACLSTLAIATLQVLVEGSRWQLIPAYCLTLAFTLVFILHIMLPWYTNIVHGGVKRFIMNIVKGLILLVFVVSAMLPIFFPVFHLPQPSGPYQIGTLTYQWIDQGRREIFSTDSADRRQLVAQIWYPVRKSMSLDRAPYVDDAVSLSHGLSKTLASNGLIRLPAFFFNHFAHVTTHAIPAAPIAEDQESFPVLIYASGLDGFRQVNMFQIQHLVSHGYIVVGLDQPYTAASVTLADGRIIEGMIKSKIQLLIDQSISRSEKIPQLHGEQLPNGIIPYLADDIIFTLNKLIALNRSDARGVLTGHLDMQRTGVFGVSLGAMVVSEACHLEPRFKACLMMDAAMPADVQENELQQPCLWLTRTASDMRLERASSGGWSEKDIEQTLSTMKMTYRKSKPGSYYVSIRGMFHINFTDAPAWSPAISWLGLTGPIKSQRGFDIVNAYSLAFFDKTLKHLDSPLLSGKFQAYPEVIVWKH